LVVLQPWRNNLAPFDAVIFDMDGVLVDGEPLHFEAVNTLLAEEGRSVSLEQYKPYMGTKAGWRELIHDFGLAGNYDHYSKRYMPLMVQQYLTRSEALPGAIPLVRQLAKHSIPLVVCSSSVLPWVEAALKRIELHDAFQHVVTGSDVEHGKPAPDIYLVAADRVGVPPSRCLAIEDAPAGIQSAKAAGMTCWAVRTEYTRCMTLPPCDRELDTLLELQVEDIVGCQHE
jgi:HAD superfamily hydrolase (TIGR01509 family)